MSITRFLLQQDLDATGRCRTHPEVQVKQLQGMLWWAALVDVEPGGVCSFCRRELELRLRLGEVRLETDGETVTCVTVSAADRAALAQPLEFASLESSAHRAEECVRLALKEAEEAQRKAENLMQVNVHSQATQAQVLAIAGAPHEQAHTLAPPAESAAPASAPLPPAGDARLAMVAQAAGALVGATGLAGGSGIGTSTASFTSVPAEAELVGIVGGGESESKLSS
eukprot:g3610.t1